MKLTFTKMQALGNDFVVIDCRDARSINFPRLAEKLCDRRFGIGADQLLVLCNSKKADFRMRIFNADGSEVEMCGNGIRCLGKYIREKVLLCEETSYAKKYCQTIDALSVETLGGTRYIQGSGSQFRIDMGEPLFEPGRIPVKIKGKAGSEAIINYPLKINNKTYKASFVSMGNPHCVIIVQDIDSLQVDKIGPLIESHRMFPNRINVEFVQIQSRTSIKMRVWERGAGETMACGTGASAAAVISAVTGLTGRKVAVHLSAGKLLIHWSEKDNRVFMTGPAANVFEGTIEI